MPEQPFIFYFRPACNSVIAPRRPARCSHSAGAALRATPARACAGSFVPNPLETARLAYHGHPRMTESGLPGDVQFVYEDASPTGPYTRPIGAYTRLGDVRDLLLRADDRMVVFGSGDELQLEFNPSHLPLLRPGWKRDYFFFVDGYEKDMDFYAADGDFVDPLPFHGVGQYPYAGESYRQHDLHFSDVLNYDNRFFSGAPAASYGVHYRESRRRE